MIITNSYLGFSESIVIYIVDYFNSLNLKEFHFIPSFYGNFDVTVINV